MPGPSAALPLLFAQNAPAPAGGANGAAGLIQFLPYIALIGLWFYLLLIRPQQKQDRERRSMIDALKKNDRVITTAGIYGTVMKVDPESDRVTVRIDDERQVKVDFSKASILRVLDGSTDKEKDKEKARETA